jgi:hypothetical protein
MFAGLTPYSATQHYASYLKLGSLLHLTNYAKSLETYLRYGRCRPAPNFSGQPLYGACRVPSLTPPNLRRRHVHSSLREAASNLYRLLVHAR